tara:strand:+ start:1853 stop:4789 length:2937 start_codon:yes stop_codon:yes gene_type:complete
MNQLDLRLIPAFKYISESSLEEIKNNYELLKYEVGQPMSNESIIPDKILVILQGQVRLIHEKNSYRSTIAKLGPYSFIGLASLLNTKGCEYINASSEVITLAIPDTILLNIYKKDEKFRNWCNSNIFLAEIYQISKNILNKAPRSTLRVEELVNDLNGSVGFEIINNQDKITDANDSLSIACSSNIINAQSGDILSNKSTIEIEGFLPGRVIKLKKSIYKDIITSTKKPINNNENDLNFDESKIEDAPYIINSTREEIGKYNNLNEFKVIRAEGALRETSACLKMIANKAELPYRADSIERILRTSIKNDKSPSLQEMGSLTSMMGLHTSAFKINWDMANRIPHMSLIKWKNNYAIVKESNSRFLEIVSPREGIIRIDTNDFEKAFESNQIELLMLEKNEQTPERKFGFRWLIPVISKYRNVLIQVLIASFVVQLFGLANPLMIQVIIDKVISQRSLDTLQILGFALVVVTILGGVLSALRTFLFTETTNRIDSRLGAEVIDHLLRLPLFYFDKRPVGELGSRVAELEKIRNFITGQALSTILDASFSLIYIIVMVLYSWLLTFVALGVVPIQILIILLGSPLIKRQVREIAVENAKTQSHLVEVLTGIQTVKAQNVESVSRWRWQDLYSKFISKSFQKTLTGTALQETSQILQKLSQLLVLWVGATLVLKGQLSLGQLIAFRIISGYVTQPILRLSSIWQSIQELKVSFERLADIIDTTEETTDTDKAKIPLPTIKGSVKFEEVSFNFINQPNTLSNISLEINPGQFVGIVGQSGSGKSTLMKLLPRLYKPNFGRIMIDDYDIDKVELYSLRRQIGIVPQEPLLFSGTVSENIALTNPDANSDEIVRAAKASNAHDFIMGLKDGYSTYVGERGAGLSGGQKQRIAIARTLLNEPKLLIMDEATSALDYDSERRVCEGLRKTCKNSTVFFITHRLSTVRNSDLIIMLDKGAVVEKGTHEELMGLKGRYFALYRQQGAE